MKQDLRHPLRRALGAVPRACVLIGAALLAARAFAGASCAKPLLPAREWAMIRQIAVCYDLTTEQTWLLAAIRRHENGRAGLEFGIGGPMNSGHPAHRYRDGFKSFYVQGAWAAGTVRNHYKGNLLAFGKRYCPITPQKWAQAVESTIRSLKVENHNKLPGVRPPKRNISFP